MPIHLITSLEVLQIAQNTDSDGREVTELFLEGLPAQFERHMQEFEAALESIKWR